MSIKYVQKLAQVLNEYNLTRIEASCFFGLCKLFVEKREIVGNYNSNNLERTVKRLDKQTDSQAPKYISINSPMVGTFYSAPSPDADPYISVNQKVSKGQIVCIIEAMKCMNEIEAEPEHVGRVHEVCINNGDMVEFGQKLFLIEQ